MSNEPRLKRTKKKFQAWSDFPHVVGTILQEYNSIEEKINNIILQNYSPSKNYTEFNNIVLNSSILGIGQKCKILSNMLDFDSTVIEKVRKLSNIRNGIAHCNTTPKLRAEVDMKDGIFIASSKNMISVMNSSGKLFEKELELEYDKFAQLEHDISPYLVQYLTNLKCK